MHQHNDFPSINQLPPELLCMIFSEGNDGVIDEAPQLWTWLSLSYNVNLLPLILKNSKSLPLSVWYGDGGYEGDDQRLPPEKIMAFLSLTAASSSRWKNLSYQASSESNHSQIIGLPLHTLQRLNVSLSGNIAYTGPLDTPGIKDICVHRCSLDWSSISRLRSLKIDQNTEGPTVEALKNILKASPDLEILRISRSWPDLDIPVDPTPISLPKLRHIYLYKVSISNYSHLLNLIVTPNLRVFAFHYFNNFRPEAFTPIFEAAGRCIGVGNENSKDPSFKLAITSTPSALRIKIRRCVIDVRNAAWSDGVDDLDGRLRCTSAALKGFGDRFSSMIKKVALVGCGNGELGSYCRPLHMFLPRVEELAVTGTLVTDTDASSVLETLSLPSYTESGGMWALPNLVTLRLKVPEPFKTDEILKMVEARKTATGVTPIYRIILEDGKVNRADVENLRTVVKCLELVNTDII
ncbi:hypothetical protein FRC04_011222 [Tulasnella sp. 424]|nr:hypothetical protein FRC04_011222 [Tulasnella sp. 424]